MVWLPAAKAPVAPKPERTQSAIWDPPPHCVLNATSDNATNKGFSVVLAPKAPKLSMCMPKARPNKRQPSAHNDTFTYVALSS